MVHSLNKMNMVVFPVTTSPLDAISYRKLNQGREKKGVLDILKKLFLTPDLYSFAKKNDHS